jgi:hypothetical protein
MKSVMEDHCIIGKHRYDNSDKCMFCGKSYDYTQMHTKNICSDGSIKGCIAKSRYVPNPVLHVGKGEDWLTVIIDHNGMEIETRIPLQILRNILSDQLSMDSGSA